MDTKHFDSATDDHGDCDPAICRVKALIDEVVRLSATIKRLETPVPYRDECRRQAREIERLKAALKTIADTGLDGEGDGFADSLIIVARKTWSE